jgi:hypothetical protein
LAGRVNKIVYAVMCRILGLIVVLFRSDQATVAQVLVLRHENVVLRRPAGCGRPTWHQGSPQPSRYVLCSRSTQHPALQSWRGSQLAAERQPVRGDVRPAPTLRVGESCNYWNSMSGEETPKSSTALRAR